MPACDPVQNAVSLRKPQRQAVAVELVSLRIALNHCAIVGWLAKRAMGASATVVR